MMNTKKSLLTTLLVSAVALAPVVAQDVQTALKDLDAERYNKAGQTIQQLATSSPSGDNQFYLGYYYLKTGQLDQAKAAFEKGRAADPKNQLNTVGLAGVALANKDRAGAEAKINEAVSASKGKDINVLIRAGEMYTLFDTNDPARALSLLEQAAKLDKKNQNTDLKMTMGDAYMLKNDGGNAISRYEDALSISPNLAEANYKIGRLYLRGKNYKLAQEFFNKAIENDPEFAPTYRALADALANSRAYKAASKNYDTYVQKSGTTDPELLLDVARYYFLAEDYQKAIAYLDQLKGKINNPITDRMYGWAYTALGQNDQAVQSLNQFISTAPNKVIYDDHKYLGRAYAQLGTPEGDSLAIVNLEKAAPQDTTENLYREIARKYYDMKRYDKAADYYEKTVASDKKPQNNDFLYMGLSNYQQGFRVGRDVAQGDTAMQRQLKQQYFLAADSAFATMAQRIEEAGDKYPAAYYYRGMSNYYAYPQAVALSNRQAVPYFEKFLEQANAETDATKKQQLQKNMITAYKTLASYSFANKDEAKGREYLTKVLELDPTDKDAKAYLEGPKTPAKPGAPKAPAKKASASK